MQNCEPPIWKIEWKDYLLTSLTLGGYALWKQNRYFEQEKEYFNCVDQKYSKR